MIEGAHKGQLSSRSFTAASTFYCGTFGRAVDAVQLETIGPYTVPATVFKCVKAFFFYYLATRETASRFESQF